MKWAIVERRVIEQNTRRDNENRAWKRQLEWLDIAKEGDSLVKTKAAW